MDLGNLRYLIVGSGFFGSVIAERIANDKGERVVVIDKRDHFGGNCYSRTDEETSIEYHQYGTHIFHTSEKTVWEYINKFMSFNGYRHQVLTTYQDKVYQMPINLETINLFYNMNLRPYEAKSFLQKEISKEEITNPHNLEEKAISLIGRPLYEAFIKDYTRKQWQKDPKELTAQIIKRLPVRYDYNESYFYDPWQGVPAEGYTSIFKKMLSHKNIDLYLNTDYFNIRDRIPTTCQVIYSGPVDQFFNYKYGKLEWRTLDFEKEILDVEDFQGTSVMNYAESSIPYTRIHEPRHLHIERNYTSKKTLIFKEYPRLDEENNPFYPINTDDNNKKIQQYLNEREKIQNVIIGGRLGDYAYYDMDKTILMALNTYQEIIKKEKST